MTHSKLKSKFDFMMSRWGKH